MTNEKEYERFGPKWKAYVMKKSKSDLVDMYRKVCIELQQVKSVDLADVVGRSEQLADKGRYCNACGDYVGKGCDNLDCEDFKG